MLRFFNYHQVFGLPMGSCISSVLNNIFMDHVEHWAVSFPLPQFFGAGVWKIFSVFWINHERKVSSTLEFSLQAHPVYKRRRI